MAQTVEKQPFCNICAELNIDLDSIDFSKENILHEVVIEEKNTLGKQLLKLFSKGKNNAKYLNETKKIGNFKFNKDAQHFYKFPIII
ncbi:MAG: hypothetical protein ACFFKA_21950 [Candidatus Thorarchaeota archaeon]